MNPWESVSLEGYERHMASPDVAQAQALCAIMKERLECYNVKSAAVLGVAGGNGLEHFCGKDMSAVYGVDINREYLEACEKRFRGLECLRLVRADLADISSELPQTELVIADLIIEYIGVDVFITQLLKTQAKCVSCVIQHSGEAQFVSQTQYACVFDGISKLHSDIDKDELANAADAAGYELTLEKAYPLPGGKEFIRLDFESRQSQIIKKHNTKI